WRTVFVRRHCLVPMTHFIEPIYKGEHAGFMVAFFQKEGSLIYAAGVWDQWVNKQTGEVIASFAIITHDPPPFIRATGHDRCPLFLEESASGEWLHNHNFPASTLKSFLTEHQESMDFSLVDHRPMRPGWEKRK
ncbi:MAG: SOS response-associated peptidase family protein, partial [Bdellovibrionales bacterium]